MEAITEQNQETIEQFAARLGIGFDAVQVAARPDGNADWGKPAALWDQWGNRRIGELHPTHWRVTLTLGGRALEFFYSMGAGHYGYRRRTSDGITYDRPTHFRDGYKARPHSKPVPIPPTLPDVLDSLLCDSSEFIGQICDFEAWAECYGYDTDSRKAEATFRACMENAAKLERLLGRDNLEALAQCERL